MCFIVLCIAVVCHIRFGNGTAAPAGNGKLSAAETSDLGVLLSNNSAALKIRDVPSGNVRTIIGANEVLYKKFEDGKTDFEVYVARWRPGNIFSTEATEHPPDVCWEGSGWRCNDAKSGVLFGNDNITLSPAEWRRFSAPDGHQQEVIYWCVAGGRSVRLSYRAVAPPRPYGGIAGKVFRSDFIWFWRNTIGGGVKPRPTEYLQNPLAEKVNPETDGAVYFIRLNTTGSISAVVQSEMFQQLHPFFRRVHLTSGTQSPAVRF